MIKGNHEIQHHDCFKLIIVVPGIVSMRCNEPIQSMVGQPIPLLSSKSMSGDGGVALMTASINSFNLNC